MAGLWNPSRQFVPFNSEFPSNIDIPPRGHTTAQSSSTVRYSPSATPVSSTYPTSSIIPPRLSFSFTSAASTSAMTEPILPTRTTLTFGIIPFPTTCDSLTINWNSTVPQQTFSLVLLSSEGPGRIPPKERDATNLTIGTGIDTAAQTWSWSAVDVPAGWYILRTSGLSPDVLSDKFFVSNGTDTSCLGSTSTSDISTFTLPGSPTSLTAVATLSTPIASSSRTSLPVAASLSHSTTPVGAIVGGTLASVGALTSIVIYFVWRHRSHARRTGGHSTTRADTSARGLSRQWDPLASDVIPIPIPIGRPLENNMSTHTFTFTSDAFRGPALPPLQPNRRPPTADLTVHGPRLPPLHPNRRPPSGSVTNAPTPLPSPGAAQRHRALALARLDASTPINLSTTPASPTSWKPLPDLPVAEHEHEHESTSRSSALDTVTDTESRVSVPLPSEDRSRTSSAQWPSFGSPVPSSATSQMYRGRESGASEWLSVRERTSGELLTDRSGAGGLGERSGSGAASMQQCGTVVPVLPAIYRQ